MAKGDTARVKDAVQNFLARGILGVALALPYRWRVPLVGWIVSTVVAPLAGWKKRIGEGRLEAGAEGKTDL